MERHNPIVKVGIILLLIFYLIKKIAASERDIPHGRRMLAAYTPGDKYYPIYFRTLHVCISCPHCFPLNHKKKLMLLREFLRRDV
jgi:hypothetical protein